MILQALYELYERLLGDSDSAISPPGYSATRASFALQLSVTGELTDLVDLREMAQSRLLGREMTVPRQVLRSGTGVRANFLCDNSGYVLGADAKGKPERAKKMFTAFRTLHDDLLAATSDVGATALLAFLARWDPDQAANCMVLKPHWDDVISGGNIVFMLEGTRGFLHDRTNIRDAWERHCAGEASADMAQCLVTGELAPVARLHGSIKGVAGAQPTGASVVSFNQPSFESYGKTQSFNAPVSEAAAFGYVTALNFLLRSERHRLRLGDTTTVFWAQRRGLEEDMLSELLSPTPSRNGTEKVDAQEDEESAASYHRDPEATRWVRDILQRARAGEVIREHHLQVDPSVRFYVLGLAPNTSRLSMRFVHVDTFGRFVERITQHYADIAIALPPWERDGFFPVWRLVAETAPVVGGKRDTKRASPLLAGALTRAILQGTDYPEGLYTAALSRVRADQGDISAVMAGIIKACLLRRWRSHGDAEKERMVTVSLNEQCEESGYLLGRLFALLEKSQQDAQGSQINVTIRDRYFGAASAAPLTVFPVLLRLAQHHLSKAEHGAYLDRRIEGVAARITSFPAHLSLEQQGMFVLGYYHQRQALFEKKPEAV